MSMRTVDRRHEPAGRPYGSPEYAVRDPEGVVSSIGSDRPRVEP